MVHRARQSKCVDTQADCVDTTGNCCRTGLWDSELVSIHRWTVSTPLAYCVDTQADCVDTTGYCFRTCFWDYELVSTHRESLRNPFELLCSEEDEECSELIECAVRAKVFWTVDFLDSLKLFFAIKYL
ncbi:hypothetical protein Taro_014220 [Colocasia esculenta]|uniref:Uncharacterized protein n=1 Tax=Colocasia esculenta TaxID=4460 RepID=A0A843UPI8_COLES|nr:hypothetical protein [Colocasia esculenta]